MTYVWRRGWDSNPRYDSSPYTHFPGVRLQPLGHPSAKRCDPLCRVGRRDRNQVHPPMQRPPLETRRARREGAGQAPAQGRRRHPGPPPRAPCWCTGKEPVTFASRRLPPSATPPARVGETPARVGETPAPMPGAPDAQSGMHPRLDFHAGGAGRGALGDSRPGSGQGLPVQAGGRAVVTHRRGQPGPGSGRHRALPLATALGSGAVQPPAPAGHRRPRRTGARAPGPVPRARQAQAQETPVQMTSPGPGTHAGSPRHAGKPRSTLPY